MFEWNEKQLKAIEGRGKNLLVAAGAGSGKTAVLIERIKRLVLEENVDADRLLVVTFTNAAAAELKERLYGSLSAELHTEGISKERRSFLLNQISLMSRASICTFDSFALDVVHNYYQVIGADPGLKICDSQRQALLKQQAMESLFEEHFNADDPEFRHFLDCYGGSLDFGRAKDMISGFAEFLETVPDPEAFTDSALSGEYTDKLISFVCEQAVGRLKTGLGYYERIKNILLGHKLSKTYVKLLQEISDYQQLLDLFENGRTDEAFEFLKGFKFATFGAGAGEKPGYDAVKDLVKPLRENAKNIIAHKIRGLSVRYGGLSGKLLKEEADACRPMLSELVSLTREYTGIYGKLKQKQGLLDFADAERFALNILEDAGVQAEYREKFRYVFVDEYQDSNMVQETLIRRVSRPDNLFMVGDVKQSIYKFRKAEPEIFLEKYNTYKTGGDALGEAIDLNRNFRSKQSVLDFANRLFSAVMTRQSCGIDYDEDAMLVRGSSFEPGSDCSYEPELYVVNTDDLSEAEDEEVAETAKAALEARQIAAVIKSYLGRPIYDEKLGAVRPLKYGDMVILRRNLRNSAEVYYKELSDSSVPVYLERNQGYFDTLEIQVFLNLLRIIDNRSQDIPLLSVLRSPVFGFDAEELAAVRVYANEKLGSAAEVPYSRAFFSYAENGPEGVLKDKCAAFCARLKIWRRQASFMPIGDFIWELLSSTGYKDFEAARADGAQRLANLRALADRAAEYQASDAGGLYGFISYVDMLCRKGKSVEIGQASALAEGADCVRILSIHKSKGLEFPFVILAGLGDTLKRGGGAMGFACHNKLGLGINLLNPATNVQYASSTLKIINYAKAQEEEQEEIRLLYVAATRAKDIFVMSACLPNADARLDKSRSFMAADIPGAGNYLDIILPALPEFRIIRSDGLELASSGRGDAEHGITQLIKAAPACADAEIIRESLFYPYADQTGSLAKRKYSVSALAETARLGMAEAPKRLSTEDDEDSGLRGAERGTAYHAVMEHIPFTPDGKSPEEIAAFIKELEAKHLLTPEEAAAVRPDKIAAFFRSSIGQRVLAAEELHKEAPFTMRHLYSGKEVLVQGTIDCFFREGDEYVLVDYKTNYVDVRNKEASLAHLKENYLPQLALYKEAMEEILGVKVKESLLYLFGIDDILLLT